MMTYPTERILTAGNSFGGMPASPLAGLLGEARSNRL
jgi:hypothetical protein